jgi:hypothetical protein
MANPAGESNDEVLKLDFDGRLMLQFCGSVVTSDAVLLAYRELDDALGLTEMAIERLADARTARRTLSTFSDCDFICCWGTGICCGCCGRRRA